LTVCPRRFGVLRPVLSEGSKNLRARIHVWALIFGLFAAPALAQTAGNVATGKLAFLQCQACHAVAPGGPILVGPNLAGIVGAKAGTRPGYFYSLPMKHSGITWTPAELDAFLANPNAVVPGNKMEFVGIPSAAIRADLIAYLATLH